jgi:outer membrane protein TolC
LLFDPIPYIFAFYVRLIYEIYTYFQQHNYDKVGTGLKIFQHVCFSFFVALLLLPFPIEQALAKDADLSFADAWMLVSAENDALQAARSEVESAGHSKDAARDLYLPEVSLSASYIYLDDDIDLSPSEVLDSMAAGDQLSSLVSGLASSYGMSAAQLESALTSTIQDRETVISSITAKWPIYAGGRIDAAQDIAKGKYEEATHNLQLQSLAQFETLTRYYFGAVLANKVFETRKEVEAGLKQHLEHAILLEQQGQIARVERLQSEAAHDKAVVERKKAGRDLEIARLALARLLKHDDSVIPADALFANEVLPGMEMMLERTLQAYPGLQLLDSKKDQVTGLLAVEKGKYYPTVGLFGSYSVYEEDSLATELAPDWFVGVGVSFPLLERDGRSGKVKAAQSTMKKIESLKNQARSDLTVLLEKTYRQAEQSLEEYQGLGSSEELAKETVKLRNKAFSQGLSTSLDVVDAELFLAGVKSQRALALYNHVVALARLAAVSGDLSSFFQYQTSPLIEVR